MNRFWLATTFILLGTLVAPPTMADVRLPHVISQNMVLQRNRPLKIWGWADKGESVSVEIAGNKGTARADDRGQWMVTLPEMKAGGPHTMTIQGNNTLTLDNILVGEVWIGSGQSNMQWSVSASASAGAEVAAAKYPKIRLFLVPNVLKGIPQGDVNANWKECSPATVPPFSAVLYYFGRRLHKELDVPVGLIASAWGGSRIEPWTPPVGFAGVPRLSNITNNIRSTQLKYLTALEEEARKAPNPDKNFLNWLTSARQAAKSNAVLLPGPPFSYPEHPLAGWPTPTSMYNAMIHPVVPFAVRGAIWYQGESNLDEGMLYYHKMRALIEGWRKVWNNDELSFYWAQLAPYNYGGDPHRLPRIWEAQQLATSVPRTGMAVITDIGNLGDIHPRNKQDVGRRLALWALAKDYGRDIVYSGPIYRSMKVEGSSVRLLFDHVGSGLESRDGQPLSTFEVAGDAGYVPVKAVIDGESVVVSSDQVANPTAVRFAWHQLSEPNLRNKEGLPACPFRTTSTAPTVAGKKLFVGNAEMTLECLETAGDIRYSLDGSSPTAESQKYNGPLQLKKTTTVRARFFRHNGARSAVTESTFTRVEPREHDGLTLAPGVAYEYYAGQWAALPDFDSLTPVKSGVLDDFTLDQRSGDDNFAFRFTGYLEIKKPGPYTFHLDSDDGSKLYIDGREVVNNDGIHPAVQKTGSAKLTSGMHKVVVTYFENAGQEALTVKYQGPDIPVSAIPVWCEQ